MQSVSFGIAGLAVSYPVGYTPLLAERGFEPAFLCWDGTQDEEVKRSEQLLAKFPNLEVVSDTEEMIRGGVQAVFCASQTHRHFDDCKALIEGRIPLWISKPMATDHASARRILDLVEQHDAPVMSCSVRRFSQNYNAVFEAIESGKIGTVVFAECFEPHGIQPGYWQDRKDASGGLVVNFGVHVVEPIVRAFGTDVARVYALASKTVVPDVDSEDTAIITIQFAGGVIAVGKVSGCYRFGQGKPVPTAGHFIVHGSEGALETYVDESDVRAYRGGGFGITATYHARAGTPGLIAAFAHMVETGRRPVAVEQMDAVMKVLDAARRSIDTGRVIEF